MLEHNQSAPLLSLGTRSAVQCSAVPTSTIGFCPVAVAVLHSTVALSTLAAEAVSGTIVALPTAHLRPRRETRCRDQRSDEQNVVDVHGRSDDVYRPPDSRLG
jgi:hypothetical protein